MTDFNWVRKHRGATVGAVLAGLVLVWGAVRGLQGPAVMVDAVVRRDFVQTVVASGRVEAPHRVDIGAQVTGTVASVPVAEGQTVQSGQLLVVLESRELVATERQAAATLAQAEAKLRQLDEVQAPVAEQAVRQAQTTLDNARTSQKRNEDLFRKGFVSAAALDDASKAVTLADAQLRTTQKQLDTTGANGSDRAAAKAALAQSQASLEAARARLNYATIRAPANGVLIARNVEAGDVVQAGKALMTLSPSGPTQLVVDIDEKNLRLLAIGQAAMASADAYALQRFPATLTYINPGINVQTGAVEVKLDVPSPPSYLRQDMTVSIDIEVARRNQALLAPSNALHDTDSANPWVLVVAGNRAERRPVRLGLQSGGYAEVLAGLKEGDRLVPASAAVGDGDRLRAAEPKR
jgi:HlyD family secretion protein